MLPEQPAEPYQRHANSATNTNSTLNDPLIDRNITATVKANKDMPLQARLRLLWAFLTLVLVLVWTMVYLDENNSGKVCIVKQTSNGNYEMIFDVDSTLYRSAEVTNVSN